MRHSEDHVPREHCTINQSVKRANNITEGKLRSATFYLEEKLISLCLLYMASRTTKTILTY